MVAILEIKIKSSQKMAALNKIAARVDCDWI